MDFVADLHIHSLFSRATSRQSHLRGLAYWAAVKGIHVVGTGDFTHPGWLDQLQQDLIEAEPGLYRLRENSQDPLDLGLPMDVSSIRFMLSSEISCIYKKAGKTRKVHTLLFFPRFESVLGLNNRLAKTGNLLSDGRPILKLDVRDLLEMLLEQDANGFMIPAHIWTPWFSLFGSKSGFDSIEDCFEDLTGHIVALETGLSSDPAMNRLISGLDRFTLVSNSDCHSPANLGREASLFETDMDYYSMKRAIESPDRGFAGTIEFFPQEGKYHFDGHRQCKVSSDPINAEALDSNCPVCGKPLTIGVLNRISELADRDQPVYPEDQGVFHCLIPLRELLSELMEVGVGSKRLRTTYNQLIQEFQSEFNLLLNTPVDEIKSRHSERLGEAIRRIRTGHVLIEPGYDGVYGRVQVFDKDELRRYDPFPNHKTGRP